MPEQTEAEKLSYLNQTLLDAGVISVMRCPSGFWINWTTFIGIAVIVFTIFGLWVYTKQSADENGYHRGLAEAERRQLRERLDEYGGRITANEKLIELVINPSPTPEIKP